MTSWTGRSLRSCGNASTTNNCVYNVYKVYWVYKVSLPDTSQR